MTQFKFFIFLLLSTLWIEGLKSQNDVLETTVSNKELFSQYIMTFKAQSLPFTLDRKGVFGLTKHNYDSKPFSELKDSFSVFVPEELKSSYPNSHFRNLYLMPSQNDVTIILLLQDILRGDERNNIKTHMITYDKNGNIINFQELAGYNTDISETFIKINNDYKIERWMYQFKINMDKEHANLFHLIETLFEYKINSEGIIEEIGKCKREGYFEGDWTGYDFVKSID